MDELTIIQEGIGKLPILAKIPAELTPYVLASAQPFSLMGDGFKALFQHLKGKGFDVWFSKYWMAHPTVLKAQGDGAAIEMRISLRNQIDGTWDHVDAPGLPAWYYQLNFVPFINTRATFEAGREYETFDIHFQESYLTSLGINYQALDLFLNQVYHDQPTSLYCEARKCPPLMAEAVQGILSNRYSEKGKIRLLHNNVENVLLSALEDLHKESIAIPELTPKHCEALYEVRRMIDQELPDYPGNDRLCQKALINSVTLYFGFRKLFDMSPYQYYHDLRMKYAQVLLKQRYPVYAVAATLHYDSARGFSRAFKEYFKVSPRAYQQSNNND